MAVRITAAQKEREVAALEREAAAFQAEAMTASAQGERDAIHLDNEAQATVLATQARAFGSGLGFARYTLYQKIAPRIDAIISSDDHNGLGAMFRPYLRAEVQP